MENLEIQQHIRKMQNIVNNTDMKEIDLLNAKQEMELIHIIEELKTQIEEVKKMKLDFINEKNKYFKELENYMITEFKNTIANALKK